MSEAKERALYLHNLFEQNAAKAEESAKQEKILREEAMAKYESLTQDRFKLRDAFNEYKVCVKDVCLQYVVEELMSTALAKSVGEKDQNMLHGLVEHFIRENGGANKILSNCKGKTYLLDTIIEEVEEETEEIVAKADPEDPSTFVVDKEDIGKLIDKLNKNDDFDEVKSAIAIRVVGAEDSFITNCKADQQKREDILLKADEKCKEVDADDKMSDETKAAIKEEYRNNCKRELQKLAEAPKHAIFDEMVSRFSRTVYANQNKGFMLENGNVDTDRVINTVKMMYSIIEAFSSSKLVPMDEEFIHEILEEL